jgi:hypothetical protein
MGGDVQPHEFAKVCSLLLDDRRRLIAYLLHVVASKQQLELPLGIETLEVRKNCELSPAWVFFDNLACPLGVN